MSRVEIGAVPRRIKGEAITSSATYIYERGTTTAIQVWTAETGGSLIPQPLTPDTFGRVEGWVESGRYTLRTVAGDLDHSQPWTTPISVADLGSVVGLPELWAPEPSGSDDYAALKALADQALILGAARIRLRHAPEDNPYQVSQALPEGDGISWEGLGRMLTVVKLGDGSDGDVFQTIDFEDLTGTAGSGAPAPLTGPGWFGVSNLTIDGNKDNCPSGRHGMAIYCADYRLHEVSARNCREDGIYSEWDATSLITPVASSDQMDAMWHRVKTYNNGKNGATVAGPHDMHWDQGASWLNGEKNVRLKTAVQVIGVHVYSIDTPYGYYVEGAGCEVLGGFAEGSTLAQVFVGGLNFRYEGVVFDPGRAGCAGFEIGDATHHGTAGHIIDAQMIGAFEGGAFKYTFDQGFGRDRAFITGCDSPETGTRHPTTVVDRFVIDSTFLDISDSLFEVPNDLVVKGSAFLTDLAVQGTEAFFTMPVQGVDPVGADDLTTKSYVDTAVGGAGAGVYQLLAEKNQPSGYAGLDAGGKVLPGTLPALAITSVSTVGSQAAQLALTAQEGDVAIRTDLTPAKAYMHNSGSAGTMADWTEIAIDASLVSSVFGRTGAVVTASGDYTAGQITNVPAGAIAAVTVQAALNELDSEKQPLDADLTALAALTTTSFGRAFLELADAAAARTYIDTRSTAQIAADIATCLAAAKAYSDAPTAGAIVAENGLASQVYMGDIGGGLAGFLLGSAYDLALWRASASRLETTALFAADGGFDAVNQKLVNLANGTASGDAVNKSQIPADPAAGTAGLRTLGTGAAQAAAGNHGHAEADITGLVADLAAKAPLASPTLTGTPAAPTAAGGTNTTQLATTAFVQTAAGLLVPTSALDTDGTLAANSDAKVATQKATKTYADANKTAMGAIYRTLLTASGLATTAAGSGFKYFCSTASVNQSAPTPGGVAAGIFRLHLLAAKLALTGLTTKLNLVATIYTTTAAPAVTITAGLYPATISATLALGTVVAGSTAANASPAANSITTVESGDFTLPADADYFPGFIVSGTPSGNFTIVITIECRNV